MEKFIPLSIPNFEGNEEKYVVDAIASTFVSTVGGYVTQMEEKLAVFLNVPNVAVCQSGTSALHLSLVEAGVKPGNVVIVPPLTFIAAVNPVKYQFATPVFIDCDDSLCMDPMKFRSFCEEECEWDGEKLSYKGATVKAIVVVHVFGNMADMESIMDTARKYNLKVVEDATEALGTKYTTGKYRDRYAGTIGDFGCYSFNGNKIITTGGGGAVTSNNPDIVNHLRFLSTQAKTDPHYYIHDEIGYNYRMTNLQAALGVAHRAGGYGHRIYGTSRPAVCRIPLGDAVAAGVYHCWNLVVYRHGGAVVQWSFAERLSCGGQWFWLLLALVGAHQSGQGGCRRPCWRRRRP